MPIDDVTLGFVAAFFTTIALLPQTIQTIRTKKTRDISLPTYLALMAGMSFWIVYGIMVQATPIVTGNTVSLLLALPILVLKLKNG